LLLVGLEAPTVHISGGVFLLNTFLIAAWSPPLMAFNVLSLSVPFSFKVQTNRRPAWRVPGLPSDKNPVVSFNTVFLSAVSNKPAPWVSMAKLMLFATMERNEAFLVLAWAANVCINLGPGHDSISCTKAELADAEIKMLDVSAERFNKLARR
jgi:hypothetical protein|tara:strand:- start:722 stop:1180 length:459 start_codon:yes stop_codon:yes gene_type:complete